MPGSSGGAQRGLGLGRLRDAEVEHLHDIGFTAARDEEDVLGLRSRWMICSDAPPTARADLPGDAQRTRYVERASRSITEPSSTPSSTP